MKSWAPTSVRATVTIYKHIFGGMLLALALGVGAYAQDSGEIEQVSVAVKVVEFQTVKGVETGLSAYFRQQDEISNFGVVKGPRGAITTADITFPASTTSGLTVFLDQLTTRYGDIEIVLQALVDQNRASILSRPRALVPVGLDNATGAAFPPTVIETTQQVPFESTVVVGSTTHQVTNFRDTGVKLQVEALKIADDDGDPETLEDSYIKLKIVASVKEEGQRITVALDDLLANSGTLFAQTSNAISVPEFVSREISTVAWVRHGQTLILGGLYRNTKSKNLATLPWLGQGQDFFNGVLSRLLPFRDAGVPVTTGLGNQSTNEGRRELVFIIKANVWEKWQTISDDFGIDDSEEPKKKISPSEVISDVIDTVTDLPGGVVKGISGAETDEVTKNLGGNE